MYIIQPLVPIPSDPVLTQPQPSSHARWKSRYMVNKLTSIITSSLQDPGFFEAAPPSWRVPAPTTALSLRKLPPTTGSASLQHPGGSPVTFPPSSPLFHNSNPLHGQNLVLVITNNYIASPSCISNILSFLPETCLFPYFLHQ